MSATNKQYAIRVTWANGEEEFLVRGLCAHGPIALFPSREKAEDQRKFLSEGFEEGEVQSIDVVLAPEGRG